MLFNTLMCYDGMLITALATPQLANTASTAERDVLGALSTIIDPDFGMDIVSCGFIKDLQIQETGGKVCILYA